MSLIFKSCYSVRHADYLDMRGPMTSNDMLEPMELIRFNALLINVLFLVNLGFNMY